MPAFIYSTPGTVICCSKTSGFALLQGIAAGKAKKKKRRPEEGEKGMTKVPACLVKSYSLCLLSKELVSSVVFVCGRTDLGSA